SARTQGAAARPHAWLGHHRADRAAIREPPECQPGVALPRALSSRQAGIDPFGVEDHREQPPRAGLRAHRRRPAATPRRTRAMGAAVPRRESHFAHRRRLIMTRFARLVAALRARFASAPERDMDEEMRFHLEMSTRRNIERGMSPDEAKRRALAAFCGLAQQQETRRDCIAGRLLDEISQDFQPALRPLRRNPGFATAVVLTLALGIGATTGIFTVVNGVLLRPLPIRNPDELTFVGWDWGGNDGSTGALSAL